MADGYTLYREYMATQALRKHGVGDHTPELLAGHELGMCVHAAECDQGRRDCDCLNAEAASHMHDELYRDVGEV